MSNHRPFFGSFLSAFRAHSAIQKAATSPTSSTSTSQTSPYSNSASATSTSSNGPSAARAITTKSGQQGGAGATTVAIQTSTTHFQPTRQHPASPYSRSPGTSTSPGTGNALNPLQSRGRRGSDSSSEGFKESLGAEKWYIGGRTAAGEERIYKLSMVKRPRSIDRLSLDRMSL